PRSTLFPYTTLFRSRRRGGCRRGGGAGGASADRRWAGGAGGSGGVVRSRTGGLVIAIGALLCAQWALDSRCVGRFRVQREDLARSEEHTSELQSRSD